jgi:putative membrane protein
MQVFLGLAFLIVIGVAIFAVQNSSAPPVVMKFLIWKFETSLVYTLLGSIGVGILIVLLFWIPRAIKGAFRIKDLRKEIEVLEKERRHQAEATEPKAP